MSRIGKQPITIPQGVQVTVTEKNVVSVKGPKGELSEQINPDIKVNINSDVITVERPSNNKKHRELHGLSRTLIANMVEGVTKGYEKKLQIIGVGYRAQKKGKVLNLQLGYSHPIDMEDPEGITVETPSQTEIIIKGINKQAVGNYAAKIRDLRPPEPYKGKGIRYDGEYVRRKEGKAGK
ncbi:50S ribosomal protein L6 [Paramaledivibacter caminithermalis]|uniref:Large ribosomal subunit protein uL6 n=1 Tax=Paramaledivibacter caminithermalis (strain DSM 15212 / CIP 107654 / DViRD3) TaxID=1121301 RepID=A0A1M6RU15_PARC5|nr:50S ribosomal protein L6 [Paramaledivibacter caminithermalis]SHK35890.1 LSU ribosomal protein L6P [Paramaledivibacter caminithermalis DSM 15212]